MASTFLQPNAIDIKNITLSDLSGGNKKDIFGQVVSFNIYEDILFPVVRADFLINDSIDLINTFPIVGAETIEVAFVSSGYEETVKYKLHVKSVNEQRSNISGRSKTYMITATSEEFITNNTVVVNKKYSQSSADIIKSIAKDFLKTKKKINIGDIPKGTQEVLISRLNPLQSIDMIRRRSVSEKYLSSTYVFFENQRGFNFTSLEFLMDNLKKKVNGRIYYHDTAPNTDLKNMHSRNLLDFKHVSLFNNTKRLSQGSLNNVVKKFDLMTGEVTTIDYKNSEKQSKFKFASEKAFPLNSTSYEKKYGSEPSKIMIIPYSSHLPETYIPESIGAKFSFATKISENIFHAAVYGDSDLAAGDVIEIRLDTQSGFTDEQKQNRLVSGNYLISKLRHSVLMLSGGYEREYTCSMELIKGSYEDKV